MQDDNDRKSIAELEDDNFRLRRLLESVGTPTELRHRARNTLAILRAIVRKSAAGGRQLDDYVTHLEDRLDSLARVQALADARGFIDLHTLIADELLFYQFSEGYPLKLIGPTVRFEPRAGQIFALAIHELAVNAVEHGVIGSGGNIEVAWRVETQDAQERLNFVWTERGLSGLRPPSKTGFGTDVLVEMLAYELGAETATAYEDGGVRCDISLPLTDVIGRRVDD